MTASAHESMERELIGAALFGLVERAPEAFQIVRDSDFSDDVTRRVWQAIRDSMEGNGGVAEVTEVVTEVRASLNGRSPPMKWYAELQTSTPDRCDPTVLARIVAREACDREERAAADGAAANPSRVVESAHRIAEIRERRNSIGVTRAPAARCVSKLLEESEEPPPEELVERLISRPGVTICYGASGSGKSYALMAAMLDLVGGGGCFVGAEGLQIRPPRTKFDGTPSAPPDVVLWVFGSEDPERRIRSRARELWASGPHAEKPIPPDRFLIATPPGICLGSAEGLAWLDREMATVRASIVVLDTIQSLTSATIDPSKTEHVSPWMVSMHRLRDKYGAVIMPVAHTTKTPSDAKTQRGKADSLLGSQAWRALADGLVMIDAPDGDASQGTLRLLKGKDIDDPIPPLKIAMDGATKRFHPVDETTTPDATPNGTQGRTDARVGRPAAVTADDVETLRKGHPDGVQWTRVWELLGIGRSTWHRVRQSIHGELLRRGHVVVSDRLTWGPK